MIDKIKFKKFGTRTEVLRFLQANNRHASIALVDPILRANAYNTEFCIIQESMFDGYRVMPAWNLKDMGSTLDNEWYMWFVTQSEYLPPDMFDERTRKQTEVPYGYFELHNPHTLFRIDNSLHELFKPVPKNSLHDFLQNYHKGDLTAIKKYLTSEPTEWPVSLSVGLSDTTRIGFFTINKIHMLLKQQHNGFAEYFDTSISIAENLMKESLRSSKGIITTFGRALEKLAKQNHERPWSYQSQELFENILLVNGNDGYYFKEYESKDIPVFYHYETYAEESGTLGRSCMRSDSDQIKVHFYAKMGDAVKILVLHDENELVVGRALLWQKCYNRKRKQPFVVMDRVYTTRNKFEALFHKYAVDHGYMRKKLNSYTNNTLIQPNGKGGIGACFTAIPEKIHKKLEIQAKNQLVSYDERVEITADDRIYLPWLDTFKYYDHIAGAFTTHKTLGGRFKCQSTQGSMHREHRYDQDRSYELSTLMRVKQNNA